MKEEHTLINAVNWTTQELIPHVLERNKSGISNRELLQDVNVAANIIKIQATHLQETSLAAIIQAQLLKADVEKTALKLSSGPFTDSNQ